MKDTDWLCLFKESPQNALDSLVHEYGNLVYAIVLSKLKGCADSAEIEDCVSDVFVNVFESISNYNESKGSLKSYICTIAARVAADAFKHSMHRIGSESPIDDICISADGDIENDAQKRIFRQKLWKTVDSLGEPDASIIVYQYCYGLTVREIAEKISMKPSAVHKRSIRAREKIRKALEKENICSGGVIYEL